MLILSWSYVETIGVVDLPQEIFVAEQFHLVGKIYFGLLLKEGKSKRFSCFLHPFKRDKTLALSIFANRLSLLRKRPY